MQLTQRELEQIDQELENLRDKKGILTTSKYWSWLQSKGAVTFSSKNDSPAVVYKFEGDRLLYEVLSDKFEIYEKWKRNGKKLEDIGNFGINDNTGKKSSDKAAPKERLHLQAVIEEDEPL